jgi:hypothetical protein
MAIQLLPLEIVFTTGSHVYAIIRGVIGGVRKYWNPTLNTGAGGWEVYNSAHWSQYAIALTEDASSGYYAASFPVGISGVITSESYYNNAAPTLGDAAISSISYSQGRNANGVGADPVAAANAQQAFGSELAFAATATPTNQVIPTTLTTAQALASVGRALIMTSGAAINCAARVIGASGSTLTLASTLPALPVATDTGVIV